MTEQEIQNLSDEELDRLIKKTEIEVSLNDSFQYAQKIHGNSLYGALANPHFRLFNIDFAGAITLTGQKVVQFTSNRINDFFKEKFKINNVALYEDTDSCYVNYSQVLQKLNITDNKKYIDFVNTFNKKYLDPYLKEQFNFFNKNLHNIEKNYFDLKREVITIGAIFIQKKKYALYVIDMEGITLEKPELKVKGIEIVRSSTPGYCRTKLKEVVEHIFIEGSLIKTTDRVKEIKKEFKKQEVSDVAFPRGINDLDKYIDKNGNAMKGCPIHVRAASIYNKLIVYHKLENKYDKIRDGDKIKFIYLNDNNPLKENIIGFKDELPKEFDYKKYVDWDLQFDKSFLSPIENIAKAMGWKFSLDTEDISDFF